MNDHSNSSERIGVYICNCGTNIAKMIDCDAVSRYAEGLPQVTITKSYKYMCSNPGQEMITKDIEEEGLDRVVIAACSPRMHQVTFRKALENAGVSPYFMTMANIREQCSWVHEDPHEATEKAMSLVSGAVRRVAFHEPLEKREEDMCPATLVIGGGIAGMTAALELADAGNPVFLVEKEHELGGNLARVDLTAPYFDSARDILEDKIHRVRHHENIEISLETRVEKLQGYLGNFTATMAAREGEMAQVQIGSVIVCTGYREFDASRVAAYGYGHLPDVVTSFDFERMLREGVIRTRDGSTPRVVAIIHCVGSRSPDFNSYCSRVCCMTALKYGAELKAAIPDVRVYDLYIDMHAFGKGCEDFYRQSSEMKTLFLMYDKENRPAIQAAPEDDEYRLLIRVQETLSGEEIEVPADMVVLMVGMEAREDSAEIGRLVNISRDKDGWFIESHPKLDPVATTTDGIFIAGACQSPKDIPDTVAQARAAAARILAKISQGRIEIDAVFAEVDEDACSGCRMCNELCPYAAIEYDEDTHRSHVISALCKACGCCVSACPSAAIKGRHYTDQQIYAQIEGVLEWASSQG